MKIRKDLPQPLSFPILSTSLLSLLNSLSLYLPIYLAIYETYLCLALTQLPGKKIMLCKISNLTAFEIRIQIIEFNEDLTTLYKIKT